MPGTPPLVRSLVRILAGAAVVVVVLIAGLWLLVAQPQFPGSPPGPAVAVDPARLEAHVRRLSETFVPRDSEHPGNLDRAAAWIRAELEATGGRVTDQAFRLYRRIEYRNVVTRYGPDDGERIVVGAHYDTFGELPGADDNASGVAALIELGRLLGGTELPVTVELVAFTLEEPPYFLTPHMGSAVHAGSLRDAGAEVRLMLSLEMIGYFDDTPGSQSYPVPVLKLFYPSAGDFIAVVGRFAERDRVAAVKRAMSAAGALPVHSIAAVGKVPGIDLSDHRNYWARGYPALMITDTAFMRNRAYHTAGDTAGRLDYARMADVVRGVYAAVLAVARE